jgi:tetratricopeptide (TPR) repeat protein
LQLIHKKILLVLIGAVVVFILIFIAPKTGPAIPQSADVNEHGLESHLAEFKQELNATELATIEELELKASKAAGAEKIILLDSLSKLWDGYRKPVAAAIIMNQKAEISGTDQDIFEAAEKHFYASRFSEGHISSHLIENAVKGYETILKRKPAFIDAKIGLAVCLVEGSIEPMRGIGLLKEVLEVEPENIKAHVNLGYFSIKSGQYEKAIERFEKVIQINPDYPESYLYLGDIYETQKDLEKAIVNYTLYSEKVDNPMLKHEISRYVEKLKIK